jgi:two-component system cell cycle response regulator
MKVLLADDDDFYRYSLRKSLDRWGYEVVTVSDGNEALSVLLSANPPSLAILDWMMPGLDGVTVCSRVRGQSKEPYIYIILITAKNQKRDLIAGLEAQADDYLIKPFDLEELRARLKSGKRIIDLQASLASKQRELNHRATHDALTGIWNRSAILDILHREADCARRARKPLCLALADIDKFKCVNDSFGHAAGDAVLVDVVQRMQSALRHYDAIGRYGGEEFIVILPGINKQRAFEMADRLRMRVAKDLSQVLQQRVSVTLSIGVAADDGMGNVSFLLRSADEALYRAKALGRNCVEVAWAGPMKERALERRRSI